MPKRPWKKKGAEKKDTVILAITPVGEWEWKNTNVTLREETEWVEAVETGWNVLVGSDPERIYQAAIEARPGVESVWPYGDGRAGERAVHALLLLGNGQG